MTSTDHDRTPEPSQRSRRGGDVNTEPRVWVECLACYNGGDLVGAWFDATDCPTEMHDFTTVLTAGPAGPLTASTLAEHVGDRHEELWVFDFENFAGILTGECSPVQAHELAERLDAVEDSQRPAFAAFIGDVGAQYASTEDFTDRYAGEYDDTDSWAWDYLTDTGMLNALPDWVDQGAVVASWSHDQFLNGMTAVSSGTGSVFVFRSC